MIYTLAAISAGCALIHGIWYSYRLPSALRSISKTVSTGLLAVIAAIAAGPIYLIVGLALSAIGDLAISRDGRTPFLIGLASGALGHLSYIFLFGGIAIAAPPLLPVLGILAYAALTEIWLSPYTGDLTGPVRIYVLLFTMMILVALATPAGMQLALVGALLLVVADTLLGIQLFRMRPDSRWQVPISVALWMLHYSAQALICLAFIR